MFGYLFIYTRRDNLPLILIILQNFTASTVFEIASCIRIVGFESGTAVSAIRGALYTIELQYSVPNLYVPVHALPLNHLYQILELCHRQLGDWSESGFPVVADHLKRVQKITPSSRLQYTRKNLSGIFINIVSPMPVSAPCGFFLCLRVCLRLQQAKFH